MTQQLCLTMVNTRQYLSDKDQLYGKHDTVTIFVDESSQKPDQFLTPEIYKQSDYIARKHFTSQQKQD